MSDSTEPSGYPPAPDRGDAPDALEPPSEGVQADGPQDSPPSLPSEPPAPPVVDVTDLDWAAVREAAAPAAVRARLRAAVERIERLLDQPDGMGMLFDDQRADPNDRAIAVRDLDASRPLWFVGDLHGDLLALEASIALIRREASAPPRVVFLGDLFDDGGHGLEVLVRVFEIVAHDPGATCVIAGNHDEALAFDAGRFTASVSPSDFTDFLNAHLEDEWIRRAGLAAIRLFERAPRALFLPDGLFVAHAGIPLADLHDDLRQRDDWNDVRVLQDFAWTRAHHRARRKIPNRMSRGSQFGHEDLSAFCRLSAELGRPVRRMVRGHDHEEERYAMPAAYAANPLLTTVALSRRLSRETFGPDVRVPTMARWVEGTLPQVHRLHVPEHMVREAYAADLATDEQDEPPAPGADGGVTEADGPALGDDT